MTQLTNPARSILRNRVRQHPDLARQTSADVSSMATPDLVQLAMLLSLDLPTASELAVYDQANASPDAKRGDGVKAANVHAAFNGLGGKGFTAQAEMIRAKPDAAPAAQDDDQDTDADAPQAAAPTAAPARDTDTDAQADDLEAQADAKAAAIRAHLGAGDFEAFGRDLRALALQALTPAPTPEPVVIYQAAPGTTGAAGTGAPLPTRIAAKSMVDVGLSVTLPGADRKALAGSTVLASYDDKTAPRMDAAYLWPDVTAVALVALSHGKPVFLTGPAGTGKTTFAEQIAARWGRAFVRISCDDQTDAQTLVGMTVPAQGGGTRWQDGQLAAAIRRPGTVVLVDEPSVARPGALFVLQALMDDARAINVAETGERIVAAPDVLVILADNTNGTGDETGAYEGTRRLNRATLDRPDCTLVLDYMPPAQEIAALHARTGLDNAQCTALVHFAGATRKAAQDGNLSHGVGLRRLMALARQLRAGIPQAMALQSAVLNTAPFDDREPLRQVWTTSMRDHAQATPRQDRPSADALPEFSR